MTRIQGTLTVSLCCIENYITVILKTIHLVSSKAAPLQTPSEIKVENEGPLTVDSSPGSPESSSSMSDDSKDSRVSQAMYSTLSQPVPFCDQQAGLQVYS